MHSCTHRASRTSEEGTASFVLGSHEQAGASPTAPTTTQPSLLTLLGKATTPSLGRQKIEPEGKFKVTEIQVSQQQEKVEVIVIQFPQPK